MGSHYDHIDRLQDLSVSIRKEQDMAIQSYAVYAGRRPDPVDNSPTSRPVLTGEQYVWLQSQGYTPNQIDKMIIRGVVNDYLPLGVEPQYSPLEKARELRSEPKKEDKATETRTIEVKNGYSVMNTVALRRALDKNSTSDIVEAIGNTIQKGIEEAVKDVLLEKEKLAESTRELVDRVICIDIKSFSAYVRPDGHHIQDHPGRLNKFLHDVKEKGGEIISLTATSNTSVILHYKIPESEIIYLDTTQEI